MIPKFRFLILPALIVGSFTGCGGGDKEVEVQGPTEEERAAQMENMTPEQREAAQAMLEAVRTQAQASGAQQAAQ
ncbi:MAG: hypothetical protein IT364_17490 [Candidatus Hydrogenedentes bacterium]|nr:hypothetical protein [Candidatus Hydrogenedentota bacterium]